MSTSACLSSWNHVLGANYGIARDFRRGLSLCPRGHSALRENTTYTVSVCLAESIKMVRGCGAAPRRTNHLQCREASESSKIFDCAQGMIQRLQLELGALFHISVEMPKRGFHER